MASSTANWIFLLVIYFLVVIITVSCLSIGGILNPDIDIDTNSDVNSYSPNSSAINVTIPSSTSVWGIGSIIGDVFGFFTFGVDLGLGAWNWLVTLVFVYLPMIMLSLIVYFSIRSGN